MSELRAGTCHICGCTEDDACRLETGEPCAWTTRERICCTNPRCIIEHAAWSRRLEERKRQEILARLPPRPKRLTPAQVHQAMLDEKRAKQRAYRLRRKKRRAA